MSDRPTTGELETRTMPLEVEARRIRGVIPYGVESRELAGGWREVIEPGALDAASLDGLIATVEHGGIPIGRYPGTLDLESRSDGLHWSVEPPTSRAELIEAVERGDLRAGSWRMRVARDEWRGNVRHVHEIAELRDVSIVADPAYESAAVELRSNPQEENPMPELETPEAEEVEERTNPEPEPTPEPPRRPGTLRADERRDGNARSTLSEEFRARGFDGSTPATLPWGEYESRAVALASGTSIDRLMPLGVPAVGLGADQRYVWPVLPTTPVDEGVTSVEVLRQKSRTLPAASSVVRAIDATSEKPEVSSELELATAALKQVAAKQSGVPNVYLAQPAVGPIIDTDLRLAINEGLDKLALDQLALAPFYDPADSPSLLAAIRHAITLIQDEGYNPDTLVLRPEDSEFLDTLRVTPDATPAEEEYVFEPGQYAPNPWNLSRRVSKGAAAPIVLDSMAFGRMYPSPVSLRTFEENDGATNTSLIRMELHALVNAERLNAAVRIAAA
jgi:HK97 family phage prohead protease